MHFLKKKKKKLNLVYVNIFVFKYPLDVHRIVLDGLKTTGTWWCVTEVE